MPIPTRRAALLAVVLAWGTPATAQEPPAPAPPATPQAPPAPARDSSEVRIKECVLRGIGKGPKGYRAIFEEVKTGHTHLLGVGGRFLDGSITAMDEKIVTFKPTSGGAVKLVVGSDPSRKIK